MADANAPRILTFKIETKGAQIFVICEFGVDSVQKEIPQGQSLLRLSAILDSTGSLRDVEVVTSKE